MNKEIVCHNLDEILKKWLDFDISDKESWKYKNIFEFPVQASHRDLVMILLDIERIFCIKIPQRVILEGKFKTYIEIYEIILCELSGVLR